MAASCCSFVYFKDGYLDSIRSFDPDFLTEQINHFQSTLSALGHKVYFNKAAALACSQIPGSELLDLPNARAISSLLEKEDLYEDMVYFETLLPLYDKELTAELEKIHKQYAAEFSHGENIPPGICPSFISSMAIEALDQVTAIDLLDNEQISVTSFIQKNINKFAVESHFVTPDMRQLRLDYSCQTKRSIIETKKILENAKSPSWSYAELDTLIHSKPELLFSTPSFFQLELTNKTDRKFKYAPASHLEDEILLDQKIADDLLEYLQSIPTEFSLELAGPGEPLLHPGILDIVKKLNAIENCKNTFLTTGLSDPELLKELLKIDKNEKLIVLIDCNGSTSYGELYAGNNYPDFKDKLTLFANDLSQGTKARVYLQTLKMVDNEKDIDELYDFADSLGIQFLFQKYNSFSGQLEERRVSDMTPLKRSFCWHLRRDLVIKADGTIPFCKQDCLSKQTRGTFSLESINTIWANQREHWIKNYGDDYSISSFCSKCDEYYTFNA